MIVWRAAFLVPTAVGAVVLIRHHTGYLWRRRPTSFAAFLETAGWIIITLVGLAGAGGGFESASTRTVEIAAALVGLALIGIGYNFRR